MTANHVFPLYTVYETLRDNWMPNDYFGFTHRVGEHYRLKALVAQSFSPTHIVEIGVRCGYSALAFHIACPSVRISGYDGRLDRDSDQCREHMQHLIAKFGIQLNCVEVNSHTLTSLPDADLAHVDGDHSYEGALSDLRLVRHIPVILADDCDNPAVASAVRTFAKEASRSVAFLDDGLRRVAILRQKPYRSVDL